MNQNKEIGVTVVIPAYNEENGIGPVLENLQHVMDDSDLLYEVIIVDDGSSDKTAEVISDFPFSLIQHSTNQGYGAALKAGIRSAYYENLVILDSDGQHSPEDIPRFVAQLREFDIVIGKRTDESHAPLMRRPGKWLLGMVANYLAGTKIPDYNSGFRAFKHDLFARFVHFLPNGFSFSTTMTLAAIKEGYEIAWLPINVRKRTGKSTVKPVKDGYATLLLIVRTIALFDPLKIFAPPSFVLGLIGIVFSIYGLFRFQAFPETGVLLIVTSIFLFFFGVLADQISALRRGLGK